MSDTKDKTDERYRHLLESKLGLTPFDCGRAIIQLPFDGEFSVSVYSHPQENGRLRYFVTCVEAEHNLWQRTGVLRHLDAARSVKVKREDAEISQSVAGVVREAWLHMLQHLGPQQQLSMPYMVDGQYVIGGLKREFSLQRAGYSPLRGQSFRELAAGTKTETLGKLADMLVDYGEAVPAQRGAIANKIEREAKQLLTKLRAKP